MNEDWKTIDPAPPKYALHANPNKPLRDAHTVIRQLNDRLAELNEQVSQLKNLHEEDEAQIKLLRSMMNNMRETSLLEKRRLNAQVDTVITERNVYRSIINRLLNLKD